MAFAFFLTEDYLKDNSPLGKNVDIGDVYPYVKAAQNIYIQEMLGTPLYQRLMDSRNASPPDTTANEIALLRLVREALLFYSCYRALPFIWAKIRNVGLVKQGGENLEVLTKEEMQYLRDDLKKDADFYLMRVRDYLYQNHTLFAEYGGTYDWSELYPNPHVSNSCDIAFDVNDGRDEFIYKYRRFLNIKPI